MFHGSHLIFSTYPIFAGLALYAVTVLVLWPMRLVFEGAAYNVAFSSKFGDAALCGFAATAGLMLVRGVAMPEWALSLDFHLICAGVAMGVGVGIALFVVPIWRSQVTDAYHNLFVVSVYVYLVLTMAPVYFYVGPAAIALGSAYIIVWILLLRDDAAENRLEQRAWLKEHEPVTYYLLVR